MLSFSLVLLLVSSCAGLSIRRRSAQSAGCGQVEGNILHSPGYPHNYPPSTNCEYEIPLQHNQALKMKFLHFDMESSPDCSYDFVEVKDIEVSYGKYCGNTLEGDEMVIEDTPFVNISFHSDQSLTKTGFEIEFEHVDKGHHNGGHEVETVTIPKTEPVLMSTVPTAQIDNIDTPLPPTTAGNQYNPSTQGEISATSEVFPTHEETPEVFSTHEATPEVFPTHEATPEVFPTHEATPEVFPTHEATPEVFPTHETTPEVFPTNEVTSEVFPTNEATTDVNPTNEHNEETTLEPINATGKRQMEPQFSNDSEEDPTEATNSKPNGTEVMTTSPDSLGNESLPTQVPVGNESIAIGNATVAPTEEEEVTEGNGDLMNTLHSTVEPEPYKPEPGKHVLEKLKLMALIQRIKFATLQMEELLIGKIVEEEVHESENINEVKREMADYGFGSYLGLGRRYERRVKRDLGTEFLEEIRKIRQERMKKKRLKQDPEEKTNN